MTHLISAEFRGESLQLIEKDGARWLTARDLGLCLGYNAANVSKGILKLYERHLDEFTNEDSVIVKLTATDGKTYNTRIFSPSGCYLLSFFANTPRAKDFRAWAKQVLVQTQEKHTQNLEQTNITTLQSELLKARPDWAEMLRYQGLGLSSREIAKLIGAGRSTVARHLRYLKNLGFAVQIAPQPKALAEARRKLVQAEEAAAQMSLL